jgi:hypothetical protein
MLSFFVALGSAAVLAAAHVNNVFTAEDMVSAPRPQPAIASPDKSHALAIVDQWDSKHDR